MFRVKYGYDDKKKGKGKIWITVSACIVVLLIAIGALTLFTDIFPWGDKTEEAPVQTPSRRRDDNDNGAEAVSPDEPESQTPPKEDGSPSAEQEELNSDITEKDEEEAPTSEEAENDIFLQEYVGNWAGSDGDTDILFSVETDGAGFYTLKQGNYSESYDFTLEAGARTFSVYVPENNASGILAIDGAYEYSNGILTLYVRSLLADGQKLRRTIPCRRVMNLREADRETGKLNIDFMLEEVREYPAGCAMSDFITSMSDYINGDKYTDFIMTQVNTLSVEYGYIEVDHDSISAHFKLRSNKKEDDYDATVDMMFYESQSDNRDAMRNSINEYTAPELYPSSLDIGDFAIGDIYHINFIRGNVFISVSGAGLYEVEIDDLARDIDRQILDIIFK